MKVASRESPFKVESRVLECLDTRVAFSDAEIGHKVAFVHLKNKISRSKLCQKRKEKKRNQYLDVPLTGCTTVFVKVLVMSSYH